MFFLPCLSIILHNSHSCSYFSLTPDLSFIVITFKLIYFPLIFHLHFCHFLTHALVKSNNSSNTSHHYSLPVHSSKVQFSIIHSLNPQQISPVIVNHQLNPIYLFHLLSGTHFLQFTQRLTHSLLQSHDNNIPD